MLAGPSAFAIDGSMEELVGGRIPRNGITLKSDTASQLRREPGRQIHPIEVLLTSPQNLVVLSRMMKVMLKETGRVIGSQMVVMVVDRMEETTEMGMETEVGIMTRHHLPRPRKALIVQRRTKGSSRREMGMGTVGMILIRILKTVMIS